MKTTKITEGKTTLLVPEGFETDPFHKNAFYNSRMEFSRNMGVLFLKTFSKDFEIKRAIDLMSSLGARGLRYNVEAKVKTDFLDNNKDAINLLKKNMKLNKVKANILLEDFRNFFTSYDYYELDPFGSIFPFYYHLLSVISVVKKKAIVSLTATDLSVLTGSRRIPLHRKYGAYNVPNEATHETALRILLYKLVRVANEFDFHVRILLCYYKQHHVKCFLELERNVQQAEEQSPKPFFVKTIFQGRIVEVGPLYSGNTSEKSVLEKLIKNSTDEETSKFLKTLEGELDFPPTCYDLHKLFSLIHSDVKPFEKVKRFLKKHKVKIVKTTFGLTLVKSNVDLREFFKKHARQLKGL